MTLLKNNHDDLFNIAFSAFYDCFQSFLSVELILCNKRHYSSIARVTIFFLFPLCSHALSQTPKPKGVHCPGRTTWRWHCFSLQGLQWLFVAACIPRTTFRHYLRVQGPLYFLYAFFGPGFLVFTITKMLVGISRKEKLIFSSLFVTE